jgi:hypothetical protein
MALDEKRRLVDLLTNTHATTLTILEGIDLGTPVYEDSGWRIRDILGHIATWDVEVAKSLDAYRDGKEYAIPNHDEDAFNDRDISRQSELSSVEVFEKWVHARAIFIQAVEEVTVDRYPGDLLYPWGDERGTIAHLVEMMAEHDVEHRDEIASIVQTGK